MSPRTQTIGIAIAVLMLLFVVELVRRRRLRIGYSLVWLMIGLGAMILIAFPPVVGFLSRLLGIDDPRSLLFTAGIAFALWILLDHSLTLTKLWRQDKELAQQHALLDWHVRQLRSQLDELEARQSAPGHEMPAERQPALNGAGAPHYVMSYQSEDGFNEPKV